MHIEMIPNKYIINLVVETDRFCVSNFLLRMVRLVNNSEEQTELYELIFEVFTSSKPVKKIVYSGEAFISRIADSKERCIFVIRGGSIDSQRTFLRFKQYGCGHA